MEKALVNLSKTISHALRHQPWLYELELDEGGWVSVEDLLEALHNERKEWQQVSETELHRIIAEADKKRFEIREGKIRAFYGHSVPQKLKKEAAAPPPMLFHGTSEQNVDLIKAQGLKPMGRQYIHLSADQPTALQVARRKAGRSVILRIEAAEAYQKGFKFYLGNEMVWLADYIPPEFITI